MDTGLGNKAYSIIGQGQIGTSIEQKPLDTRVMLEEAAGPGRRFTTAPLEHPYGRGVNFQIRVSDVDGMYQRLLAARSRVVIALEERWYRANARENGNRQFVVADPDGYLLRFFTDLGDRPA